MKYKRDNKKKDRGKKRTKPKKRYIHRRKSSRSHPHKRQKILSKGIGKAGARSGIGSRTRAGIGRRRTPHRNRLKQRLIDIVAKQGKIKNEIKDIKILQNKSGRFGVAMNPQRWEDLEEQRLGQLRSVPFDERQKYYIDQDLKRRNRIKKLKSEWNKEYNNQGDALEKMHQRGYYTWATNREDIKDIISGRRSNS